MSVKDFKQSCNYLTSKFAKIDKRSHSIANLRHANSIQKSIMGGVWLPCCRPGIPCFSRIMASIEPNTIHKGKILLVACSEVKYCLLSTRQ